jgi:hypothetical protein
MNGFGLASPESGDFISPLGATSHAFMVSVIVYSRCMARTPDAAGESADTGTYRRARACASGQRSNAGS